MNTPLTTAEIVERLRARAIAAKRRGRVIAAAELFEAAAALLALEVEVARCHERLEIDHYFKLDDNDLERVEIPMAERASFPDAVTARDETIKLLEEQVGAAVDDYGDEKSKREAAEAELAKVREERDAFFDKLRQLLCINSVLTALKADAPLWLEHAEKLIDDHNAALAEKTV